MPNKTGQKTSVNPVGKSHHKTKGNAPYTDKALMKRIAIWKANHPEETLEILSQRFDVKIHVARYALQKWGELAETMKATKKGRYIQSRHLAASLDPIEALKSQLNFCLSELENDHKLTVSGRSDQLFRLMRVRVYLQQSEIESHIKRLDATIIASIVRRYKPEASDDEIIKIYTEEYNKWKAAVV